MYGLDMSHFTWAHNRNRPPTQEQLEFCRDFADGQGVRWWSINTYDQSIARAQIEAIVNFNWPWHYEINTYRYVYIPNQVNTRLRDEQFIAECRRNLYNIQYHWLDVEDPSDIGPHNYQRNIDATHDLIRFWEGKCRTGLYSAKWIWDQLFGGYQGFTFMDMWGALWNWEEELNLTPQQQFGGFTRLRVKQTMGSNGNPGDFFFGEGSISEPMLIDTNYLEEFMTPPHVEPPKPDPTEPEKLTVPFVITQGPDNTSVTIVLPKNTNVDIIG
jgi:hypothetical protein